MNKQALVLLLVFSLFMPLTAFAVENILDNSAISRQALYAQQTGVLNQNSPIEQQAVTVETREEASQCGINGFTQSFKSHGGYLNFGLRTGYIYGQNTYDLNHNLSELEFPMRAYMGGGNIDLGYKRFSWNSEFWGSLFDDPSAGWHTKDKDWDDGELESDTKSYSDMNAVIWDSNLRYNFLDHSFNRNKLEEESKKAINLKLGLMVGYRYERFGYKDYGLYQTGSGEGSHGDGELVSEYKIKYQLPYYGLGVDVSNDKFGVLMKAKYAFKPHAKDYDNHALRSEEFFGDYKKSDNVFMANLILFWKFCKNWEASLGADAALIRIAGRTWDETHDPVHDNDQAIDTKQFIYWMGLGYRF